MSTPPLKIVCLPSLDQEKVIFWSVCTEIHRFSFFKVAQKSNRKNRSANNTCIFKLKD